MTILLTGATGRIGSRLLPRLVAAGIDCRALVRPGKQIAAGATAVEGDLLDPASLAPAVQGVSAIVHLAAVLRTPDVAQIEQANFDGTRNLIAAAREHAPDARFIMTSTGLVYAADLPRPAREDDPATATMPYPASKIRAEAALRESGLTWSVLRLAFVYGDGDDHLTAAPGLLASWNWHPAQKMSLIHHRDIATAVQLSLSGATDARTVNIADDAPRHRVRDRGVHRRHLQGVGRAADESVDGPHGRGARPRTRLPPIGDDHVPGRTRRPALRRW